MKAPFNLSYSMRSFQQRHRLASRGLTVLSQRHGCKLVLLTNILGRNAKALWGEPERCIPNDRKLCAQGIGCTVKVQYALGSCRVCGFCF